MGRPDSLSLLVLVDCSSLTACACYIGTVNNSNGGGRPISSFVVLQTDLIGLKT